MFQRIYVEIGNICNLHCSFCPSTSREQRRMNADEFRTVCERLLGHTEYLYLHVMGEPLYHPELCTFLDIAKEYGYKICITTNGTLLPVKQDALLSRAEAIHRISISLHCIEGNGAENTMENYLNNCISFAKKAAEAGIYTVFRLWNLDSAEGSGANKENALIEETIKREFQGEWQKRWSGFRVAKNIFLEYAGLFTWPGESTAQAQDEGYCHGLCDQIAILADGTVVPCCLDSEGVIKLGNVFDEELSAILSGERAKNIREGFENGKMTEDLCKKCTYARRFKKR